MKAVTVRAFGAPETFRIETVVDPAVPSGAVRVQVKAAAVNFVDGLVSSGLYQVRPDLPFTPGGEFAGVVDAVGDGVSTLSVGDRVCGSTVHGAWGELVALDARLLFKIPDRMIFAEAAIFRVSNATAYHALVQRADLKAGEIVLVLGAGGGVGYAAVQIAKALGARVIASASSQAKRDLAAAAGADAVITSDASDWRDQVKAAAGRAVDIVVDPVGGELTETAFRCLGWGGRHLVIGFAAGAIARLPTNLALVKGAALVGVDIRQFSLIEPESNARNMRALFQLHDRAQLVSAPIRTFELERFADALNAVKNRDTLGRAVLKVAA